jgi:hypothetical protein
MYIICILVIPISNYVMYVFWWDLIRDSRPVVLTIGHFIVKLIKKKLFYQSHKILCLTTIRSFLVQV